MREPRVERRKDFHAQSVVGFLIGLNHSPMGWNVWVPELKGFVTSTNVEFDESIPPPDEAYHRELESKRVTIKPQNMSLTDLRNKYLNKMYVDDEDGLMYEVIKIRIDKTSGI